MLKTPQYSIKFWPHLYKYHASYAKHQIHPIFFPQIPKFSQLFHRNNDQTDLRDLLPGSTYTVDLVFITDQNQTTKVTNTNPITFTTLTEEGLCLCVGLLV